MVVQHYLGWSFALAVCGALLHARFSPAPSFIKSYVTGICIFSIQGVAALLYLIFIKPYFRPDESRSESTSTAVTETNMQRTQPVSFRTMDRHGPESRPGSLLWLLEYGGRACDLASGGAPDFPAEAERL
jgi:hypothetical protein